MSGGIEFTGHNAQSGSLHITLYYLKDLPTKEPRVVSSSLSQRYWQDFSQQVDLIFPCPEGFDVDKLTGLPHAWRRNSVLAFFHVTGPLESLLLCPALQIPGVAVISCSVAAELGNSFAILPGSDGESGTLVIRLDRESFQWAGLPGVAEEIRSRTAKSGNGKPTHYICRFPIGAKSFRPGQSQYEQVARCLRKFDNSAAAEALVWLPTPNGTDLFPPSLKVQRRNLTPTVLMLESICCPELDFCGSAAQPGPERVPPSRQCHLLADMHEWLGAVSCGLTTVLTRPTPVPYTSTFEIPQHLPYRRNVNVCRLRLFGMIPQKVVQEVVDSLSTISPGGGNWAAVTYWRFRGCPGSSVIDGSCEKRKRSNSHSSMCESSVTIVAVKDEEEHLAAVGSLAASCPTNPA